MRSSASSRALSSLFSFFVCCGRPSARTRPHGASLPAFLFQKASSRNLLMLNPPQAVRNFVHTRTNDDRNSFACRLRCPCQDDRLANRRGLSPIDTAPAKMQQPWPIECAAPFAEVCRLGARSTSGSARSRGPSFETRLPTRIDCESRLHNPQYLHSIA